MADFTPPTAEDYDRLARQWVAVSKLTEDEYGRALTQGLEDLDLVQRLLDDDVVDRGAYALQCLGVALGRVLATNVAGLDWWAAQDGTGRDLCLRWRETSLRINPITMISKRVERGERVDVADLYRRTADSVAEITAKGDLG